MWKYKEEEGTFMYYLQCVSYGLLALPMHLVSLGMNYVTDLGESEVQHLPKKPKESQNVKD